MFDIDRILAIPDESVDYLQCGIAGKERAALAARGFVRKDGTKAKDYMIRTIQKTEKNKAKTEKAIIKGDKPLVEAPKELTGAARIRAKFEQKQREQYNIPSNVSVADFLAEKEKQRKDDAEKKSQRKKTWGDVERKDYSKKSDYHLAEIESLKGNATVNVLEKNKASVSEIESNLEKERKRFSKLSERGMDSMSSGRRSTSKATAEYGAQLAARNIDTLEKYLDARKGLDSALKAETPKNTPIAPDTAKKIKGAIATSATPKSRKVVKGESPDTRNAGYINYGGGKAQNGKIRLVDYRNKDVNAYVAKLDENGDRKFVNDHGKADTNAFKGKENVKEWNIKKLEDGVYEANSRQGVGTRGVEKSYFSVKKGKIDNYFDNYQQAKEVLTPKEKRINKTSLSGSSDKQISYAESVRDKAIAKLQSKGLSPSDIQKAVSDPQTQTARWWLDNKDNAVDKIYNTMMKQKISRL